MSISKDCLHNEVCKYGENRSNGMYCTGEKCKQYKSIADVAEVRHGSWGFDGMGWTCSECGEYALSDKTKMQVHSVYCPHCGAKMDGERSDE